VVVIRGGGWRVGDLAKFVSPVTYLDKDSTPILLMHGSADGTVPYQQSEEMLELCRKSQVTAELVRIDGAPHAFWFQPKWAGETLDKSARFFHSVLDRTE
jgi:dipeptidyl aminopeptidase/acylaminoacyl peptidase